MTWRWLNEVRNHFAPRPQVGQRIVFNYRGEGPHVDQEGVVVEARRKRRRDRVTSYIVERGHMRFVLEARFIERIVS